MPRPTAIEAHKDQVLGSSMGGVNDLPNAPSQTIPINYEFGQLDFNFPSC
jgi:hypothetical protein